MFFWKTAQGHLTILIPDEDKLLQELLLTTAHCSFAGYPNKRLTAVILSRQCTWKSLKEDTKNFVDQCTTCKMVKPPYKFNNTLGVIRTSINVFGTLGCKCRWIQLYISYGRYVFSIGKLLTAI